MKKILAAALICAVTVFPLTGCGKSAQKDLSDEIKAPRSSKQAAESVEKEEVSKVRTLGTDGANAYDVLLTNQTGQDIRSLKVGTDDTMAEAVDLLESAEVYANNEQVELFYTPAVSEDTGESEKELAPEYEIGLTFADGTEHTLHAFPFDDIEEGIIKMQEEGILYLSYHSISTGQMVETLDAEKAILDQAKQEAERAAEASKAEEEAAEAASVKQQEASTAEASLSSDTSDASASSGSSESASSTATETANVGNPPSATSSEQVNSNTSSSVSTPAGDSSSGSSSTDSSTVSSEESSSSGSSSDSGVDSASSVGSSGSSSSTESSSTGSNSSDSSSTDSNSGSSQGSSGTSNGGSSSGSSDDEDACVGDGLTW